MRNVLFTWLFLFLCFPLFPDISVDVEVEGYNEPVMSLDVSRKHVDFGPVNPEMREKEYNNAVEIVVRSNVKWELTLEMLDELTNENGYKLPAERLMYRCNTPDYRKLKVGEPVVLITGGPTDDVGRLVRVDMKMKVEWGDEAGTYRTVLRYTLSPQP